MNLNTRATTRTWDAHTTYRECGVVTGLAIHVVTITRTRSGFKAVIDGRAADVLAADSVLRAADRREVIAETLEPVIGNAAACALYKELARLGYRAHYILAGEALERAVSSLAALTAADAAIVRSYAYGQLGLAA